ncbi:uncharacterized protein LOC103524208 [Diaphorina citri]|uniref:Uncharacterized protein LOC103524208 n=1 Tax=Diaphorina citri TaxID=121845 RepID=A0A3Q0JPB3_DIACI|nr:uncharacterized protein LOC103524208 [Diaphorina citri]
MLIFIIINEFNRKGEILCMRTELKAIPLNMTPKNTAQMYFLFFIVYCLLLPVQLYAVAHQRHPVTKLFTASLILEVVGIAFNLLDVLKYAYDGVGYSNLSCLGER